MAKLIDRKAKQNTKWIQNNVIDVTGSADKQLHDFHASAYDNSRCDHGLCASEFGPKQGKEHT